MMSVPAILGAVVYEGYSMTQAAHIQIDWIPTIIGTVCAAVSGFIAIKFMLALITRKKLYGFAIYVAVLGILVLLDRYVFHLIGWA